MTPPQRVTASPSSPAVPASPTPRPGLRRRAKRGVVAGYIHEISGRHRDAAIAPLPPLRPAEH
jgi:hypothetical protein